jgi:glycosyltransferase involved in cell wall biosynthesis
MLEFFDHNKTPDMGRAVSFFINRTENEGGPSIFGYRLRKELIKKGWRWNRFLADVSFIFSAGFIRPFCRNILRLDGLYFDSENTLGDSDKRNLPMFRAYRNADGIIFQSEFSLMLFKHFASEPRSRHVVIPNGAPSNFSPGGEKVNYGYKKTLICSAKWSPVKRLDCIIEGFLEYGNLDVGLVIIGESIEKRIEHPNIKYLGKIPSEELPKYLRGGDAFIHLSWFDSCPNTVVEALACGLPVLSSHNGGTKEIIKSNGIIIQCEEDWAFQKVAVFKPPKCHKRKVADGIEQILNWDKPINADYLKIEQIVDRYMKFAEMFL